MVEINIDYKGGLRCEATHGPSRTTLITDAPIDNQGKGEAFSPTDLVATALGTCLATIMAIAAGKKGIELKGTQIKVQKEMSPPPRRIAKLSVEMHMPLAPSDSDRRALEAAALACPVHKSLSPETQLDIRFFWKESHV